jgi:hypothetical protein
MVLLLPQSASREEPEGQKSNRTHHLESAVLPLGAIRVQISPGRSHNATWATLAHFGSAFTLILGLDDFRWFCDRGLSMSVFIGSYQVVVSRHVEQAEVRHLYMEADPSESGAFKHFALYFYEKESDSLGYMNSDNGHLVPFLPLRDFDNIYHILQTEKKVYANWHAAGDNKLVWFQVGTSSEPLGEGLTDQS